MGPVASCVVFFLCPKWFLHLFHSHRSVLLCWRPQTALFVCFYNQWPVADLYACKISVVKVKQSSRYQAAIGLMKVGGTQKTIKQTLIDAQTHTQTHTHTEDQSEQQM